MDTNATVKDVDSYDISPFHDVPGVDVESQAETVDTVDEVSSEASANEANVEHIGIDLYSYTDPVLGGIVKMKINELENMKGITPNGEVINSNIYSEVVKKLVSPLKTGTFKNNFNNIYNQGKKTKIQSFFGQATTRKMAIANLREKSVNANDNDVDKIETFIGWLNEEDKNEDNWRYMDFSIDDTTKKAGYDYYNQLMGDSSKAITSVSELSKQQESARASAITKLTELHDKITLSEIGNLQKEAIQQMIASVQAMTDMKKISQIEKNAIYLNSKNLNNGLLYAKNWRGAFENRPMGDDAILKELNRTTYVRGGRKTRNQKSKKTRRNKRYSRRH